MPFTLYQSGILPGLPDRLVFEQDDITVGDLFRALSQRYGDEALEEALDDAGGVAEGALVILNGVIIRPPEVLATKIPPGSELVISALIAGG